MPLSFKMFKHRHKVIFFLILICNHILGLEYNKYRLSQNTDFLLHEAGIQNTPKKDNVIQANRGNSPSPNHASQSDFPPLVPPPSSYTPYTHNQQQGSRTTQSSGKRDYIAPNYPSPQNPANQENGKGIMPTSHHSNPQPAQNSQSSGKRDYVSPNYPQQKTNTNIPNGPNGKGSATTSTNRPQPSQNLQLNGKLDNVASNFPPLRPPTNPVTTQTSGKRDYVNPNIPTHGSTNNQQGKVKDLINFYDNKNQQPPNPPKTPSYSSIAQGSTTNHRGPVHNLPTSSTPKPFSFSSVVSGSTHHSTTAKPAGAFSTPLKPLNNNNPSTTRPSSVVPSSNVNRNQGNVVSDVDLQTLSEELLRKDTNNAARYITINYQGKTTSQSKEDKATLPLLTVSPEVWAIPTIQKFIPLLDNYERDTLVNEHVTPQERNEENAFMDAIMSTTVVRYLMNYLKDKGYVTPDPRQQREFLKQLWFSLYSRGKGKISSSGFEHSFVSELKNGEVSGLHNWIYLTKEEQANRLNYLGYLKYEELNGKGAVIKLHFNHQGTDKPVDSIFVGTSPELEISLYTLCFLTRADNDCNLKLGGKDVTIKTYTFRYRSKNLIGSAFPQI